MVGWWDGWRWVGGTYGVANVFCFDAGDDGVEGQFVCCVGLCGVAHGCCVLECIRRGGTGGL